MSLGTASTSAMTGNWRTINIDALDPDSPANFDMSTLVPTVAPVDTAQIQQMATAIRQQLRGGDHEGALRSALENAPYGGDEKGKELHLQTVTEILQSIRQSEMTPLLTRIYNSDGGSELCDTLMKYIYKGMAAPTNPASAGGKASGLTPQPTGGFSQIHTRSTGESGGQAMSVLLSWHEKLVEIAGLGSIVRVLGDRRTV